jgi:hypothetical protein
MNNLLVAKALYEMKNPRPAANETMNSKTKPKPALMAKTKTKLKETPA